MQKIYSSCGDEFQTLSQLETLAQEIVDEAKKYEFDFERNKDLLNKVALLITKERHVRSFEFRQSGLLEALQLYLSQSP